MWRLRQFKRRLINLIRWFPIIWKDEQWDHYYIYEILKYKLIIMSSTIREKGNHTLAEYDANRMMLAVRLIEKIQNEDYVLEFLVNDEDFTKENIEKGDAKHNKAKRILFKLLENYIERWWD
jgi:hypothetical protein